VKAGIIAVIIFVMLAVLLVRFGGHIHLPRWMGRRTPTIQYQFMPLHNTTAKIMVVDEGVRFLPAPQPRTDGTIYDQLVAELGFDPLAPKVSRYNFPLAS
jgi:hypothetical protein